MLKPILLDMLLNGNNVLVSTYRPPTGLKQLRIKNVTNNKIFFIKHSL